MTISNRRPSHLRVVSTSPKTTSGAEITIRSKLNQPSGQPNGTATWRGATAPRLEVVTPLPVEQPAWSWPRLARLWLSLMKPITWVPVVWSFWCGAVGAGGLVWSLDAMLRLLGGLILAGPLLCGMSQAINDYFDREVDAVNEPWRVLPSGQLSLRQAYGLIAGLGFGGLAVAYCLGPVVTGLAFLGIFLAHNYSAPPIRLKRFTWLGPASSAVSYVLVPWLAAASVFGGITWRAVILAGLYSFASTGTMILNDFKSIIGDYKLRLPSVPVVYGTRRAAQLACAIMDSAQGVVGLFLLWEGRWWAGGMVLALVLPQLWLQRRFIREPLARAIWYNARGQNFLVLGMLLASWLAF